MAWYSDSSTGNAYAYGVRSGSLMPFLTDVLDYFPALAFESTEFCIGPPA